MVRPAVASAALAPQCFAAAEGKRRDEEPDPEYLSPLLPVTPVRSYRKAAAAIEAALPTKLASKSRSRSVSPIGKPRVAESAPFGSLLGSSKAHAEMEPVLSSSSSLVLAPMRAVESALAGALLAEADLESDGLSDFTEDWKTPKMQDQATVNCSRILSEEQENQEESWLHRQQLEVSPVRSSGQPSGINGLVSFCIRGGRTD